jgi:hypothetical protein
MKKILIMKWTRISLVLLFTTLTLISCSDDAGNEPATVAPTTTTDTATGTEKISAAETASSEAGEKKSDAAVQGLKEKVKVLSESSFIMAGGKKTPSQKMEFRYDEKGNRTELITYTPDGKLNSTLKSHYDPSGNLLKEETILGNGLIDFTSAIKLDSKGRRIEQKDTRSGNETMFNHKYYFKYDEKGQLFQRTAFRNNGSFLFRYDFKFDERGNRTEWIQAASDSSIIGRVLYKFNDKNELIEETTYRGNTLRSSFTYTYEYDKKRNWIRRTKSENGKVVEIKERNYTYY